MKHAFLRAAGRNSVSEILAVERRLEIINGKMLPVSRGKFFWIHEQALGSIHHIADIQTAVVGAPLRLQIEIWPAPNLPRGNNRARLAELPDALDGLCP